MAAFTFSQHIKAQQWTESNDYT